MGSILNAVAMHERGGDTAFANTEAAHEGPLLPSEDSSMGSSPSTTEKRRSASRSGYGEWDGERFTELHPVEHPVVRTHPEAGKRSLFVNPEFSSHRKGFSRRESDGLLELLYQHMVDQRLLVRYNWKAGDLGFWDNRATMHLVVIDYGTQHRLIQRVTIKGERPYWLWVMAPARSGLSQRRNRRATPRRRAAICSCRTAGGNAGVELGSWERTWSASRRSTFGAGEVVGRTYR